MLQGLNDIREYLQGYYKCSWYIRRKEICKYKRMYNRYLKCIEKDLIYNRNIDDIKKTYVIAFVKWIRSKNKYIVTKQIDNQIIFQLVRKDFCLLVQIALSNNSLPQLNKYTLALEIHYLVSVRERLGVGAKFIKDFIAFSDSVKLPIVLYCEPSLVSYYTKFGFVAKSINYQGYYLMVYGNKE